MRPPVLACLALFGVAILSAPAHAVESCEADLRPLRSIPLELDAPQAIAIDRDGSLWICSALSQTLLHVDARLRSQSRVETGVPRLRNPLASHFNGIAYNSIADTLLLSRSSTREIWEVDREGTPTGTVISLNLPPPVNVWPVPFPKGIAFDPLGNGGESSIWVVESVMTAIYEVSLAGEVLRSFCHPDDPDGCPGESLASYSNDIGFVLENGRPVALEIVGGTDFRDQIRQVQFDGSLSGISYPLVEIGGRPGGFTRGEFPGTTGAAPREVFYVTVESSAELHVLEILEPRLRSIVDLSCGVRARHVELDWRNTGEYDGIDVLRDGAAVASLPGSATSFTDESAPDGILDYEVVARRDECRIGTRCSVVLGAGQVLHHVVVDDLQIIDITEDDAENLWVTHATNEIGVYDKELNRRFFFPGPFQNDNDVTSGIAYNPVNRTFFVYNATTNRVGEMDGSGVLVAPPFASGVPGNPAASGGAPLVTAMLFDPAGAGGAGSFWYVDYRTGTLQERDRDGRELRTCLHPDWRAEPPPPPTRDAPTTYVWGVSTLPDHGFDLLEISGGRVRDGQTTRLLRLSTDTCEPVGIEIPTEGIAAFSKPLVLNFLRTSHRGRPVAYVIDSNRFRSWFFEVNAREPEVPHVTGFTCRQETPRRDVELSFSTAGDIDVVEILRNGTLVDTVDGSSTSHVDRDVPPGYHTYELRARRGATRSDERSCSLDVGPGSVEHRGYAAPISFIHQLAYDPLTEVIVAASNSNRFSGSLHLYDSRLSYRGKIPSPFSVPWQVASLAVRSIEGFSEYYCLGWKPGASREPGQRLPVRVIDPAGDQVREFEVEPPEPREGFVVFPSGMAWDASTDTLWYLERNSRFVVNISLDGQVLSRFPHPAPVHQDDVSNYGLAIDASRNALYFTSAGRRDRQISRIVEVTRGGKLTGVEIPVGSRFYDKVWGFALHPGGTGFVVAAREPSRTVSDLVLHRAFDPVKPVSAVRCSRTDGGVEVSWVNEDVYDSLTVYRETEPVGTVAGQAAMWLDSDPPVCDAFYRVVAHQGSLSSAGVICEIPAQRPFIRGDVEENGRVNITDAVSILEFLFLGGDLPACPDAADVDDSGGLNITDPVRLLNFLFISGDPPEAPFPSPGCDTTVDPLGCP